MKSTTAIKRFENINVSEKVRAIINTVLNGENTFKFISYSVFKSQPTIEAFAMNNHYSLYDELMNAFKEIGFKIKSKKTIKAFDITIKNIEYI